MTRRNDNDRPQEREENLNMSDRNWPNLAAMFFDQVDWLGDRPFLWVKRHGDYKALSWGDTAARVTPLARGLLAQGVEPGDRVMLVSENRPAWLVSDLAIMSVGAITVPAYTTNTEDDHLHILRDSGARGVIVSNRRLAERVLPAVLKAPEAEFIVAMDLPELSQELSVDVLHMDDVLDRGRESHQNIVKMAGQWAPGDTACINYTSGTGGAPKGVMLSHRNILSNCEGAENALMELGLGNEVFLSFLPLSHSYEHMAGQFFPMTIGAEIYYAEGADTLAANLMEARPTIMTAVPRLYETFHHRITLGVRKAGGAKERLFNLAVELGTRRYRDPDSLSLKERLIDWALDNLVRAKVEARFGGRLKALVSGGAPLNPEIGMFFTALGLRILQGYGQTETSPSVSVNVPSTMKLHTVGPPLKGVEVKIADDGEILVRGELVMQGYWRNDEATRETIRDGWVHTGDIGLIDGDGHLRITDRKKDIIVNSGGDNISPQRVEGILTIEPEIAQAMVYGDKHPHLVSLLVADADWLSQWAKAAGKPALLSDLAGDGDLVKALGAVQERVNAKLSNIEKVRRLMIATEPFTTDNGLLTPTLKIRRHKIKQIYGEALEALYR
jgi:long-chain acyl-CoA synthetase|tara:strand:+ start:3498 stop:5339 length:1842 start_codon:yes stop_codon:yes gene_type:complete